MRRYLLTALQFIMVFFFILSAAVLILSILGKHYDLYFWVSLLVFLITGLSFIFPRWLRRVVGFRW